MIILNNNELADISGGAIRITAALINATSRVVSVILDLGRSLGTSVRMIVSRMHC